MPEMSRAAICAPDNQINKQDSSQKSWNFLRVRRSKLQAAISRNKKDMAFLISGRGGQNKARPPVYARPEQQQGGERCQARKSCFETDDVGTDDWGCQVRWR